MHNLLLVSWIFPRVTLFAQAKVEQVLALDPFDEIEKSTLELVSTHTYIHIHIYIYTLIHIYIYTHIYVHIYIHTYMHTHIHKHIYT